MRRIKVDALEKETLLERRQQSVRGGVVCLLCGCLAGDNNQATSYLSVPLQNWGPAPSCVCDYTTVLLADGVAQSRPPFLE